MTALETQTSATETDTDSTKGSPTQEHQVRYPQNPSCGDGTLSDVQTDANSGYALQPYFTGFANRHGMAQLLAFGWHHFH